MPNAPCHKVVGVKQATKAVRSGTADRVLLADDADPALLAPLEQLCRECGVPAEHGHSLAELGTLGGIKRGASVVACLKA